MASGSTSVVALLAEDVVGVFSFVIVDVEELLLNVLARGARWVSFSFLVSFHDIASNLERWCRGVVLWGVKRVEDVQDVKREKALSRGGHARLKECQEIRKMQRRNGEGKRGGGRRS